MTPHAPRAQIASRAIALLLAAALPASLFAVDPAPSTTAVLTRTAEAQVIIKANTRRAAQELTIIIAEFERNGMGDDADAKTLIALRSMLERLSDKDMEQVIGLLKSAAKSGRGLAGAIGEPEALTAYKGQRNIATELRLILIKYQRQIEMTDLAMQFGRLADRQDENFKSTRALAQRTGVRTRLDEEEKISLQVRASIEGGIKDEALALLAKFMELAARTTPDDPNAPRIAEIAEQVRRGELEKTLAAAVAELSATSLHSAAATQRSARDQLRAMARLLSPKRDDMGTLQDAMQAIEARIEEQRHLNGATTQAADSRPLEPAQGDVVDKTDVTRTDLGTVAPDAAAALSNAIDNMQDARAPLAQGNPAAAQPPQASALKALEMAKAEVGKKLEEMKAAAAEAAAAAAGENPPAAGEPAAGDPSAAAPGDPGAAAAAQMGAAAGMGMGMGQGMGMGMGQGMGMGMGMGMGNENMPTRGLGNRMGSQVNASSATGGTRPLGGTSSVYLGLPPRDRMAVEQSRSERYPAEYAGQIEQYLKNLSQSEP